MDQRKGLPFENHFEIFTQKKNFQGKSKCFECGGFGHMATECANRKQNTKNNKALTSTWDDSDKELLGDNEVHNLTHTSSLHQDNLDDSYSDGEISVEINSSQVKDDLHVEIGEGRELEDKIKTLELELKAQTNLNVMLTQENEKL